MGPAIERALAGEVDSPDEVLRYAAGPGVLNLAPLGFDLVAVAPEEFADEGLANGGSPLVMRAPVEAAIKDSGDRAAARLRPRAVMD